VRPALCGNHACRAQRRDCRGGGLAWPAGNAADGVVADVLRAHPFGQMYEAINYQIARGIWYRIGWAGRSPFIGATDKAGPSYGMLPS
jgi:hypothetical protein